MYRGNHSTAYLSVELKATYLVPWLNLLIEFMSKLV